MYVILASLNEQKKKEKKGQKILLQELFFYTKTNLSLLKMPSYKRGLSEENIFL